MIGRQAWDTAWAAGKGEELEQAGNEFIAAMQTMVPRVHYGPGSTSDGREVSIGGAARFVRGPNDSSVPAPGCDQRRGTGNGKRSAKERSTVTFTPPVISRRGELVHRGAYTDATDNFPPAGGMGN